MQQNSAQRTSNAASSRNSANRSGGDLRRQSEIRAGAGRRQDCSLYLRRQRFHVDGEVVSGAFRHGKKNFEVVFLVMNPGYNEINYQTIKDNAQILNVPITVFESDIFNIVASEEQSPCYLCARMRRGYLYSKAKNLAAIRLR